MGKNYLFEISTIIGSRIRTTKNYWSLILQKHPEMKGYLTLVKNTLKMPDMITKSKIDKTVFLFYRKINSYWICVVSKCVLLDGFVITAYITDKIKEGEKIWPS